jgi:hypothetical protein
VPRAVGAAAVPHSVQKRAPLSSCALHRVQRAPNGAPHVEQNLPDAAAPQDAQLNELWVGARIPVRRSDIRGGYASSPVYFARVACRFFWLFAAEIDTFRSEYPIVQRELC